MDDKSVHSIYKALVNSGLAFGARRWVAILDRQCERLASVMANNISAGDVGVVAIGWLWQLIWSLVRSIILIHCLMVV
ncbi:Homeobox-leucine zipper protein roc2 [Orobanche gracilis]